MPIYEYRCSSCFHAFERLVSWDEPNPPCPACGHEEVDKLFSTFGTGGRASYG